MRRSTVVIADDHLMVLEGLVHLLEDHDFEVIGTVGDGNRLIDLANERGGDDNTTVVLARINY